MNRLFINNDLQSWVDPIGGKYAAILTQEDNGDVTKVQTSHSIQGCLQTVWSNDFGKTFDSFIIGILKGHNICQVLFLNLGNDMGFIVRAQQTNGVIYDVHFGTNELSFYKSMNGGDTFDLIWTCNIVKH